MSKKNLDISRRKLIAGLGTAGVAAAGAGLGTTAYLNDTETFEDNSITAGTLDMSVTARVEAVDEYWSNQVEVADLEATADGEAVTGIEVSDVKPGDWAIICFDIDIGDNPGYVRVSTANLESEENGYTEPEPEDENGEGELEEAILATVWSQFDDGDRSSLSGLDGTTNMGGSGQPGHSWDSSRAEGGEVSDSIHYTTLQEAFGEYSTGVTIRDPADGNADSIGSEEGFEAQFCLLLEIPTEVGNEIQGDSLSFDLVFDAVQARHNDAADPTFNASAE